MAALRHHPVRLPTPEHPLLALVHRFRAIHIGIGVLGNSLFVAGSLMFLSGSRTTAIWLFIMGSTGMLIGSLGSAAIEYRNHRRRHAEAGARSAAAPLSRATVDA